MWWNWTRRFVLLPERRNKNSLFPSIGMAPTTVTLTVQCHATALPLPPISFHYYFKKKLLHAVFRTQQGRQREPNLKTIRSPLSAEFWPHCVLSSETHPRGTSRALPRHQSKEMEIFKKNISSPRVGIEPTTSRVYSHFVPLRHYRPPYTASSFIIT